MRFLIIIMGFSLFGCFNKGGVKGNVDLESFLADYLKATHKKDFEIDNIHYISNGGLRLPKDKPWEARCILKNDSTFIFYCHGNIKENKPTVAYDNYNLALFTSYIQKIIDNYLTNNFEHPSAAKIEMTSDSDLSLPSNSLSIEDISSSIKKNEKDSWRIRISIIDSNYVINNNKHENALKNLYLELQQYGISKINIDIDFYSENLMKENFRLSEFKYDQQSIMPQKLAEYNIGSWYIGLNLQKLDSFLQDTTGKYYRKIDKRH